METIELSQNGDVANTPGTPAHLAGTTYLINQKANGKFQLRTWDSAAGQWCDEEFDHFEAALAVVEK